MEQNETCPITSVQAANTKFYPHQFTSFGNEICSSWRDM